VQIDVVTVTVRSLRLLLPLTIWSCHAWVAPTFRLYHGLAAAVFGVRDANRPSTPRPLEPLNPAGFTVIELIVVIVIIGVLAATVLPNINFGTTSSTVSSWGAAYIIASDIRYTQECAMASMVSKGISFTNGSFTSGQIVYTFPATAPSTSSLDPTGRLPSAVTIGTPGGNPFTLTFNSLGEPEESTSNSITVTVGGITRTITVTQYTGMVSIS